MPDGTPTPNLVGGRYQLIAPFSEGAVTQRWTATDTVLARTVIVECLRPAYRDDLAMARAFEQAAVAVAQLAHPGLAAVYDTGSDDTGPYAVMMAPRGRSLRALLDEAPPLPPRSVVAIGNQLAALLVAAHRRQLVHGAIGPDNVVVADDGHLIVDGWISGAAAASCSGIPTPAVARDDVTAAINLLCRMLDDQVLAPPAPGDAKPSSSLSRTVTDALAHGSIGDAQGLRGALAHLDLGSDESLHQDSLDFVDPDPTHPTPVVVPEPIRPHGGGPPRRPPRSAGHRRRWVSTIAGATAIACIAVITAIAVIAGRAGSHHPRRGVAGTSTTVGSAPLRITLATTFDPTKNLPNQENPDLAHFVFDGNPTTVWSTQEYATRMFGKLKPGVGLVVSLDHTSDIRNVTVTTPHVGWTATVYVAAQPASTLVGWGAPAATFTVTGVETTINVPGTRGGAVLLWITDLGDPNPSAVTHPFRVDIAEISVQA